MNMTNAAAAALIIGALMPFLVTFLKQDGLGKGWNEIITILACAIAGTLTVWATGGFGNFKLGNLLVIIAGVFIASQAAYAAYWKGTGTEALLNQKSSLTVVPVQAQVQPSVQYPVQGPVQDSVQPPTPADTPL